MSRSLNLSNEVHSESLDPIQQLPPITDVSGYDGDIIRAEKTPDQDYAAELAFNEEPVTIRIEPSSERNAARWMLVQVNGKGAEVLINGKWHEFKHLPIGRVLTTKRKYAEIIVNNKTTDVTTPDFGEEAHIAANNRIDRETRPVHGFSVIEDRSPRGHKWLSDLYRRP